jgi:heat shock protein HslJ
MKNNTLTSLLLSLFLFSACCTTKTNNKKESDSSFYDTTWELEYISGTRIAFEGLYPEGKPTITLKKSEMSFGGNSSCNTYSGTFTLKETLIQFGETIQTMRFCEGGGEQAYFGMLKKVNKYTIDSDGKLLFLIDDVPMMRFKKVAKP